MTYEVDGFQILQAEPRSEPRKYDLAAMEYVQWAKDSFGPSFIWKETPQGYEFWRVQCWVCVTDEGRAALAEMRAQWEMENGKCG